MRETVGIDFRRILGILFQSLSGLSLLAPRS